MAATSLARAAAPCLSVIDGIVTTISTHVAAYFGKRHDDVLKAIRALLAQLSPEHGRNFAEMLIDVAIGGGATRQSPAYRLTRDGFTLLAMGFTGKRALQFKLAYIDAFNRMEAELREQQPAQAPSLRGLWLVGRAVDGSEHATKLREDQFVVSWPEIAADMRAGRVPAEHCAALREAAAVAFWSDIAGTPDRSIGRQVADAIRAAREQLSLADLHTIATAAAGQLMCQASQEADGANSRAREVLRALPQEGM